MTGRVVGGGSVVCRGCGQRLNLETPGEIPECPSCGGRRFDRASLFDPHQMFGESTAENVTIDLRRESPAWLEEARASVERPGEHLAYLDGEEVCVMPVTSGWTRIGRSVSADIRLDDPTVSRRHALIVTTPEGTRVLDDRSLNGVFVNGERVEWAHLAAGDEIVVGRYRLYLV
jgi:FHA domain/Zinc-ribbon containing domain